MGVTLSGSYHSGITLSANPTTITGSIKTSGSYAAANFAHIGWSLVNEGVLQGVAYGVELKAGSTLVNGAHGTIYGASIGVGIYVAANPAYKAPEVYNAGTIRGGPNFTQFGDAGVYLKTGYAVQNTGFPLGSTLVNAAAGVIYGADGVKAINVLAINQGHIGAAYSGIGFIGDYGTLSNASRGVISNGVDLQSDRLLNAGTIQGGVFFSGLVTGVNEASGTITDYSSFSRGGVELPNGTFDSHITNSTFVNYGLITGNDGAYDSAGVLVNSGVIEGLGSVAASTGQYAYDQGVGVTFYRSPPGFYVHDRITNSAAGTISGKRIGVQLDNVFSYSSSVTTFTNAGLVVGSLGLDLGSGVFLDSGTIKSTDTAGADAAVGFTNFGYNPTLVLERSAVIDGHITGFATGETIILAGFTVASDSFGSSGLVLSGPQGSRTLELTGSFDTNSFVVTTLASGPEITLNAICYLRGTRILTPAGEVAVEDLAIGDAVVTKFGGYQRIKWIGRQDYARRFVAGNTGQVPVRFAPGALGEHAPARALYVSPGHSMLLDGALVLARDLVNGVTITQSEAPETLHYYQLEFATHDCVLAEGVWAESYFDAPGLRGQFHNVADFYALYPRESGPAAVLCAARLYPGRALSPVLRPIVACATAGVRPGRLLGCIDESSPDGVLRGWAWDAENPALPVLLEVLAGGRVLTRLLACEPREDLAGMGPGRCAFSYKSPIGLPAGDVRVRRVADGVEIFAAGGGAEKVSRDTVATKRAGVG